MSKIDEIESWKLQARISDLEHQLSSSGASVRSSTSMLLEILNDAKRQLTGLQMKEQSHNEDERRKADAQLVAVVQLVAQETALNQRERQQYGAFIQKEFFTKNDFTALEDFYASAWDRLTDGGKAQMSHRVWEGVRRDEYQFSELPDELKEKEAQSVRDKLSGLKHMPPEMNNISATDRNDFTRAWDSGRKNEAYTVLDRPSFAENVALVSAPILERSGEVNQASCRRKIADIEQVTDVEAPQAPQTPERKSGKAISADLLAGLDNAVSKPTDLPSPTGDGGRGPK